MTAIRPERRTAHGSSALPTPRGDAGDTPHDTPPAPTDVPPAPTDVPPAPADVPPAPTEALPAAATAPADLTRSDLRLQALIDALPVATAVSDVGLRIGYANARMGELFGVDPADLVGTGWLDAVHADDREALVSDLVAVLQGQSLARQLRMRTPAGPRQVDVRATPLALPRAGVGFVATFDDVTERTRLTEQLAYQASHDELTGLPNRATLWRVLHEHLGHGTPLLLGCIDVDHFKHVNDWLGHTAGDQLLLELARRLRAITRGSDQVFRLTGDEFVVVAQGSFTHEQARQFGERLVTMTATPIQLDDTAVEVSASVGLVTSHDAYDAERLVRDAEVAMYQAKDAGRNRYALFDEAVQRQLATEMRLAQDLRAALPDPRGSGLSLAFQPIVNASTRRVMGFEALLRWRHPHYGPIPPPEVVALAETHRLIEPLGCWILHEAVRGLTAVTAQAPTPEPLFVTVNVAATQLFGHALVRAVDRELDAGLDPSQLVLELTETALMTSPVVLETLTRLRWRQVGVAIDDFGTGYSSLAYLSELPVSMIKADRSFIATLSDLPEDAVATSLAGVVASLGRGVGLRVLAEGIEDETTAERVAGLGYAYGQGYLFGRPMALPELVSYVQEQS